MYGVYGKMSLQEQEDIRLLLKQIVVKERMQGPDNFGHIVSIPKDFYQKQKEFLSTLQEEDKMKMQSLYHSLIVSRKSRLVSYAEALIPIETIQDNISDEEFVFYKNMLKITTEFSDMVKID